MRSRHAEPGNPFPARRADIGEGRRSVTLLACLLAFGLVAALPVMSGEPAQSSVSPDAAPAAMCAFCRSPLSGDDFCPHCGRLARIVSPDSEHRFWGDVPYVLTFPPQENAPEIGSEFSAAGLTRETVRYASGDRYEMKMEKRGARITGKVGWLKGGQETEYSAEVQDEFDARQRLISRQVTGELKGGSDTHLYRRLDFKYRADGRLDRIEFTTSLYGGASDWKKSPAAWLRHRQGEIALLRGENGMLLKVETSFREGKRSLRGEPEYGEPGRILETVVRDGDEISRVSREQP
jgi:hypothetical protein